jgi:predicted MFS family arabinose efflux permease
MRARGRHLRGDLVRIEGLARIARTLRHPSYGPYVAGNSVSLIGLWVQRVAVGWLAWELTGSATWLGIISLADLAPAVLIGPFAGAYADRADRLRIVRVAQTLAMLQAAALALLTAVSLMRIELLATLVLINGVVIGFNQPARLSLVPSLVPRADLPTAVAINSIVFNLARFVGPALAGVIILWVGVAAAFAVNAASFLAFLVVLGRIRVSAEDTRASGQQQSSLLAAMLAGARYTVHHAGIGPMLGLMLALAVGVRPFIELLPGFADRVFHGGAAALAALASAVGLGAVMGGLWLAWRGEAPGLTRAALASTGLAILCTAAFASTSSLPLALVWVALTGAFLAVAGVGAQIGIQTSVDPRMRARVLSLYGLAMRAGPALGALLMGVVADRLGLGAPLLGGAGLVALAWWVVWRRRGRIARGMAPSPG